MVKMIAQHSRKIIVLLIIAALLAGSATLAFFAGRASGVNGQAQRALVAESGHADVSFRLKASSSAGRMAFVGVGGDLDGVVNPDLAVEPGDVVEIILEGEGGAKRHQLAIEGIGAASEAVVRQGDETRLVFTADQEGTYAYYDTIPGNRYAGMEGRLVVGQAGGPADAASAEPAPAVAHTGAAAHSQDPGEPTVSFTLKTAFVDGKLGFSGASAGLEGTANPDLLVQQGDVVEIVLVNDDGMLHNLAVPDLGAQSADIAQTGEETRLVFKAEQAGEFPYYCAIPGHRQAGMEGKLIVAPAAAGETVAEQTQASANAPSISRPADDLPGPITRTGPEHVRVDLETVEVEGRLADGTTYKFWTFNGLVPGPFIRVRSGDTVEVHLKNAPDSMFAHSVDFHAVTGPGGGAVATQTQPGGDTTFTFKALNPGLYVYHCATPMVAHHISNGMYGLILVEPEGGLQPVDREFYVMQGEIYTSEPVHQKGPATFSVEKLLDEDPEYFVLNGAVGSLTEEHPLQAKVGETVRIFYGVGGPNYTSSFHVIGEIFDQVYDQGSITAQPLTDVQTTLVPAGGATMVEFELQVPGRYILVDHALSRMERGLAGYLVVEGPENPDIYHGVPTEGSGH